MSKKNVKSKKNVAEKYREYEIIEYVCCTILNP